MFLRSLNSVRKSWISERDLFYDLLIISLTIPFYSCYSVTESFIDEGFAVLRNEDVTNVDKSTFWDVLVHDFWGQDLWPRDGIHWTHKSFRPLVTYSFRWPFLFFEEFQSIMACLRISNCLCHTLCCLVMRRMWFFKDNIFAVLLFAVQPAHVENVVYFVGRADVLGTLFFCVGANYEGLQRRSDEMRRFDVPLIKHVSIVLLWTIIAGLCKETVFTLPVLTGFLAFIKRENIKAFMYMVGFFAIFGIRSWYVEGTTAGFGYIDTPVKYQDGMLVRFWSYLSHHLIYCQLMLCPWNLSWDYSFNSVPIVFQEWGDLRSMAVCAVYVLLVCIFFVGFSFNDIESLVIDVPRRKMLSLHRSVFPRYFEQIGESLFLRGPRENEGDIMSSDEEIDEDEDDDQNRKMRIMPMPVHHVRAAADDNILIDLFAGAAIVIPFVPASNLFFLVGTTVGERLLYPCTVGSCLLIDRWLFSRLKFHCAYQIEAFFGKVFAFNNQKKNLKVPIQLIQRWTNKLFLFLKLLFLGYYMYVSYLRVGHWSSHERLFKQDVSASKWQARSAKTLHSYAVHLQKANQMDEAMEYYTKALNVFDDNAMTDYCIARLWLLKGIRFCKNFGPPELSYPESHASGELKPVEGEQQPQYCDRAIFETCHKALLIFDKINNGHGIGFGDHNQFMLVNDYGFAYVCLGVLLEKRDGEVDQSLYAQGESILLDAFKWQPYPPAYVLNALAIAQLALRPNELQQALDHLQNAAGMINRAETKSAWWKIQYNVFVILIRGGAVQQASELLKTLEANMVSAQELLKVQELHRNLQTGEAGLRELQKTLKLDLVHVE